MLKRFMLFAVMILSIGILAACGSNNDDASNSNGNGGGKEIDELKIGFVPSKDPDEIITATEPLKDLLKEELEKEGITVNNVDISVGTTYEAVGEALSAGTTDVGLVPGGTFVLYDDGAEVILTSTRAGLNNDSEDAKDWNDNKPTEGTDEQATYYRSLFIAGPSEKGQELAEKVNKGEELTWEDLNSANWSVMGSSSSAGYIYPVLWLLENYDKSITDLDSVVQSDSYGSSFARLAAEQTDVLVAFADARRDYAEDWESKFDGKNDIWEDTNVIGVTDGIYNDTISVSKNSDIMDDELKAALQKAFINIAETEEGKEVISIYSHEGYQEATSEDYETEREAQQLIRDMK
ncbi:MAG TPA: PhnD/SsuA/transferrin family substrate-binding protein [Candidatus Pseudogracilibacillus intestinigallinarum]|uniref:PhnD/SsuA/transferrin family substrate-binding protein n=1 Tax=Candidatus Pseudogracilibacillus intestinigallinarum TaxID=2838742 RepID=A0A9D1TJN2_9BACI|nr:PhnD/SsuA/transferrin family substrate-binding protein [Candidatus Pseudogracilibacillus intestinigallinarum]